MSCSTGSLWHLSSLVGTARPAGGGDVEGDVERGHQRHPGNLRGRLSRCVDSALPIADQPGAKTARQRKLHDQACPLRRQDGRRFLPPEELRIVPQPGRERPPISPWRLTLRSDRGVAHVSAACQSFGFDWARDSRGTRPAIPPQNTGPFHGAISRWGCVESSTCVECRSDAGSFTASDCACDGRPSRIRAWSCARCHQGSPLRSDPASRGQRTLTAPPRRSRRLALT